MHFTPQQATGAHHDTRARHGCRLQNPRRRAARSTHTSAGTAPKEPHFLGASDASGLGMGCVVRLHSELGFPPTLWRRPFPGQIRGALVTADHPHGTISISDLELAALIAHKDVLAQHVDTAESIAVAHLDTAALHQLDADWGAVLQATKRRVSPQRVTAASSSWHLWVHFCHSLRIDPDNLPRDPVPLLQIFAQRLRDGTIAPGRKPVRARTVEDALRAVGQAYAGMGALDPRLSSHGQLDFRLSSLYRAWATTDDPPSRVKPLPIGLLAHMVSLATLEDTPAAYAAAECLTFGFYFLLRPGEYLGIPNSTDNLFRLKDLQLWVGSRALDLLVCPLDDVRAATFATLTFTRQKNGVRNERIGHGRSGHPTLCPVLALSARVLALRRLTAPITRW
ncbi:hypothetical protein MHU86_14789 [Fragilaria crotonensis]|nr:hypothetical protein MHU86_14789 [Fragilaria crotonensis]